MRIRRVGAVDEQVGLERERVVDVVGFPLPGVEGDEFPSRPRFPDDLFGVCHVVNAADARAVAHLLPAFAAEDDRAAVEPGRRLAERRDALDPAFAEVGEPGRPGREHRRDARAHPPDEFGPRGRSKDPVFQAARGFDEVGEAAPGGEIHRDGVAEMRVGVEEGGHDPPLGRPGGGLYRGDDPFRDGDGDIFFPEVCAEERTAGDDVR
ncbi:hypothetical protein DSECCO2_465340 [anaerobic digester metagenome]